MKPKRSKLDSKVAGRMAAALLPADLSPAQRDTMLERIMQRINDQAPPGTMTIRSAEMQWRNAGPGVLRKRNAG